MSTPQRAALVDGYGGSHTIDLNQMFGTHQVSEIYDTNPILTPSSFMLSATQPFTGYQHSLLQATTLDTAMVINATELDAVQVPYILYGKGLNYKVALYADSAGNPTGLPLASAFIPKEHLRAASVSALSIPSTTPNLERTMWSDWQFIPTPSLINQGSGTSGMWITPNSIVTTQAQSSASNNPIWYLARAGTSVGSAWQQGPSVPAPTTGVQTLYIPAPPGTSGNGWIVAAEGYTSSPPGPTAFNFAPVNSDGSIGGWQSGVNPPGPNGGGGGSIILGSLMYYSGYVYLFGGHDGTTNQTIIYSCPWNNGQMGAWTNVGSVPSPSIVRVAQVNGYVVMMPYSVNGTVVFAGLAYIAKLTTTGGIGAWTKLPAALPASVLTTIGVGNGVMFINQSTQANALDVTPLGEVSAWSPLLSSAPSFGPLGGASTDGLAFIMGTSSNAFYFSQPYKASVITIPLRATGLTSGNTYHVVWEPTERPGARNLAPPNNLNVGTPNPDGIGLAVGATTMANYSSRVGYYRLSNFDWAGGVLTPALVSLFGAGVGARPVCITEDAAVDQTPYYASIVYDTFGKPVVVNEVTMPRLNLLDANSASFGETVPGSTVQYNSNSNITLALHSQAAGIINYQDNPLIDQGIQLWPMYSDFLQAGYVTATTTAAASTFMAGFFSLPLPVGAGAPTFTLSAYVQNNQGSSRNCQAFINYYDASTTLINQIVGPVVSIGSGNWRSISATGAPSTAAATQCAIILSFGASAIGENYNVDLVCLRVGTDPTYFHPGAGPGYTATTRTLTYDSNAVLTAIS